METGTLQNGEDVAILPYGRVQLKATGEYLWLTNDYRGGVMGHEYDLVRRNSNTHDDKSDAFGYTPDTFVLDDVLQPTKGERKMPTTSMPANARKTGYYKIAYYDGGTTVSHMSDNDIFEAVKKTEGRLKQLKKLNQKNKAVKHHQKALRSDIKNLMREVNSRY